MKAIVIVKMKTNEGERGKPDVLENVSFVHTGVELPGAYQAMIISGTPAQLNAITQSPSFVAGQVLTKDGDTTNWEDARTKIAPGARNKINNYLTNHGHRALTAEDSIETLLQIFDPDYTVGNDDIWDAD